jgi:hypothetical protein
MLVMFLRLSCLATGCCACVHVDPVADPGKCTRTEHTGSARRWAPMAGRDRRQYGAEALPSSYYSIPDQMHLNASSCLPYVFAPNRETRPGVHAVTMYATQSTEQRLK